MRVVVCLLAAQLVGCAGLRYTVDRDLLAEITIENKLLLFDAENDVSIALDEREQISREIYQTKVDISDAELQIAEAENDEDRAAEKGEADRAKLAAAAQQVFALKVDYLYRRLSYLREKLDAQDHLIMVAKAKYELAKATLVKKNNVRGASDIELEDYEEQVGDHVERAKESRVDLAEVEKEVDAYQQRWLQTREQLMAQSGGGVGSPWAEDSAMWGGDY